jgi:hypothetical protein
LEIDSADDFGTLPSNERVGQLEFRQQGTRSTYFLLGRPLRGGDMIDLCFSGGWVTGRYEWSQRAEESPVFHFSVELGAGRVWQSSFAFPEGALLRWPRERSGV